MVRAVCYNVLIPGDYQAGVGKVVNIFFHTPDSFKQVSGKSKSKVVLVPKYVAHLRNCVLICCKSGGVDVRIDYKLLFSNFKYFYITKCPEHVDH